MNTYRTIVADPPWRVHQPPARFEGKGSPARRAVPYPTLSVSEIAALPVESMAEDDAHLYVWTINRYVEQTYEIARAWGFKPLTILTWCKKQPGVGYYLRNNTEHCILASRGKPMVPDAKAMASWYVWPRAEHSRKPEAFLDLVEQVSPGPYVEIFARRNRFGWDTWGNESLQHVEVSA